MATINTFNYALMSLTFINILGLVSEEDGTDGGPNNDGLPFGYTASSTTAGNRF
ncbi:hypothetical protein [Colwellia sp. RSH04]|uniref:hypothetical protein n=1 Tax=Colwellia sp. RSH04 TaxID=2305464 RepID=UPI0015FCA458|nr:hypothetical protein [Colwellia sp. RSH04]